MSSQEPTFVDMALSGEVLLLEIDNFVKEWHDGNSAKSLHDYLGLTSSEYALWVSEPDMLAHIVRARRDRLSLDDVVEGVVNDNNFAEANRIAARGDDFVKIQRLKRWLESEGIDLS